MTNSKRQLVADLTLLFVTAIWGATFTMVKDAVTSFPVFTFLAIRFGLALLILLPAGWQRRKTLTSRGWQLAGLAGLFFFAGFAFQTWGLRTVGPGRAGFITGLSVVIVPLGSALIMHRRPSLGALIGVTLATGGLFALTWQPGDGGITIGDWLVLSCAFGFAGHILIVGILPSESDWRTLAAIQVTAVFLLCIIAAGVTEGSAALGHLDGSVLFAAAFTGVLATAVALGLQTRAQQFTSPTHTALIFAAEPVFAALFGYLLASERLGNRELFGGALIILGMVAAELKIRTRNSRSRST